MSTANDKICYTLLLPLLCAAVGSSGCPPSDDAAQRVLVVAAAGDALTLDPAALSDVESMQVAQQIFETLVRYRESSSQVEPALATRWSVSEDGRRWTFHLRRDVLFHDGTPLTASAVVYSFERQRDRAHPAHFQNFTYWENLFREIVGAREIDRYTVEIRLERPYAPFLANLAIVPVSIVSPTAMRSLGKRFESHPVGTGPFRFVGWDRGRRIVLARFDRYWGRAARVDRLVFQVVGEAHQRLVRLQSRAVDVVLGLAPQDRQIVALHPDLRLQRVAGNNVAYLAMHTGRPPFDDVRLRRAVNYAINQDAIVKLVYQGLAVPAHGPVPPGIWSHNDEIARYPHDPERARRLIAEVGEVARPLRLLVMSTPRPYMPSPLLAARMIARNLADVGLEVEIISHPHGEHLQRLRNGEHDLCLMGWVGDNNDPDNFLYVLLDRDNARLGTAQNVAFFTDERVHELLVRGQQERSRQAREAAYRQAQQIVAIEAPWVPLAHTVTVVARHHSVRDLTVHPSGAVYFHGVSVR